MTKRQNRLLDAVNRAASHEFDRRLELSTTYCLAAMVLAMDKAHCKVNIDKWFDAFAEIYPAVIADPKPLIKQAEEVAGMDIEIHWEKA